MPITGWTCPECKRGVPLDHYESGGACSLVVHPDYTAAVLDDQRSKADKKWPSVTMGLGCPRKAAILKAENVEINPLALNAPLTGTAWHKMVERPTEHNEVAVSGELGGLAVNGTIDRLRSLADGRLVVEDWKHGNCFSRKYAVSGAKDEHVVQVSLYAELAFQTFGARPSVGVIWYHYTSSPPFVPQAVELWPVEKCLEHKPYAADWAVGQLLKMADDYAHHSHPVKWTDLPLVGQTIKFGSKSGCDYCEVKPTCLIASGGAPF